MLQRNTFLKKDKKKINIHIMCSGTIGICKQTVSIMAINIPIRLLMPQ